MGEPENQPASDLGTAASHGAGSDSTYGPMFVAPTVEELNESLPQFEFVELLGQGGMGAVYKARQPRLDRYVAIKLLPAFAGLDEHNFAERFEREARAMAKMNHPNIVTVHDFGETDAGHRYIVMEYVDGYDLHHAIQSGELTSKHVLAWIPLICKALDYAHEHGLVHRDIKPANILISKEGEVKVGDFGLAKLVGRKHETSITKTRVSMGTPDYAAPEALEEGGVVDRRADIYSLGVLCYELFTGKVPRGAWKPPSAYTDIDVRLDQIIIKAMQPDAEHRYQSVSQMLESLNDVRNSPKMVVSQSSSKQLLTGTVNVPSKKDIESLTGGDKSGSKTSTRRRERTHPLVVAGIAIGGILLAVGVILLLMMKLDANAKAQAKIVPNSKPPRIVNPGEASKKDPVVVEVKNPKPNPPVRPKTTEEPKTPPPRPQFTILDPPRPNDGWADLMEGVRTKHRGVEGNWELGEDGVLVLDGKDFSKGQVPRIPFAVQAPQKVGYEVKMEVSQISSGRMFGFLLPVDDQSVFFAINAPSNQDKISYCGISMVDGRPAGHPENPTRTKLEIDPERIYDLELQVLTDGNKVGIYAALDSKQVLRWEGKLSQLKSPDEARGSARRLITVVSMSPLSVAKAQMRTLGPGATLAGKPAPPKPEPVMSPELLQKLADFEKTTADRIATEAEAPFQDLVATQLHKGYEAALGRLIETAERSRDLLTKASALRELERISALRPIEPEDPPEMPQAVKDARARYRVEIGKLEAQRDLLLLPILRDQLISIESLRDEFASLGKPALDQIDNAANPLRKRITEIEEGIPSAPVGSPIPRMAPGSPEVEMTPEPTFEPLQRASFPRSRPVEKGEVVAWGRKPDMAEVEMGDVPAGLATTAVAIAGYGDCAVALKSNGKLQVWGKLEGPVPVEITGMSGIVDVAVSYDSRDFHFAALDESGSVEFYALGWGDLTDEQTKVGMLERVVGLGATPRSGFAVLDDGSLGYWGRLPDAAAASLPDKVAKLKIGPGVAAAICEDRSVKVFGGGTSSFPPNLTEAIDLEFGQQEALGGVAILPDGKALTFGSFAGYQDKLSMLLETKTIEKVVAGLDAFAVLDSEQNWHFFGANIDPMHCAAEAAGCSDVVIGNFYVIGLR